MCADFFSKPDMDLIGKMKPTEALEIEKALIPVLKKLIKASKRRAVQANVISTHIQNSSYPVIVCGDFNDTPVSYVYHKIRGGLKYVFVEAGKGCGGIYNGRLPSYRIDFILFYSSFNAYNYKRKKVNLSDHYPVFVTLDLTN
jgi:endonuclease/exonuclease/phosphatase family metal-dependent hydrolase